MLTIIIFCRPECYGSVFGIAMQVNGNVGRVKTEGDELRYEVRGKGQPLLKIFMAAGKQSLDKKRFYAQTAQVMAERLGCDMVVFPGHHASFVDTPDEWAATLRDTLHKART